MSGGSYEYIYLSLEEQCKGAMYDAEMNDLIEDLCELLHDLEWWQSGDYGEEEYRKTLLKFKKKWFQGVREKRLKDYIDKQVGLLKGQLYCLIGIDTKEGDAK